MSTAVQPRIILGRGPHIGEKAAYFGAPDGRGHGPMFVATIMDIRDLGDGPVACLATPGWPHMGYVALAQYQEMRDGVWRACSHSRGFNVAGLCFDCGNPHEWTTPDEQQSRSE